MWCSWISTPLPSQQRRNHHSQKLLLQHSRTGRPDIWPPTANPRIRLSTINIPALRLGQNLTPLPHHRHRHPSSDRTLHPAPLPLSRHHPPRPPPPLQRRPPRRSMLLALKNRCTSLQPASRSRNPRCYQVHRQRLFTPPAHLPSFILVLFALFPP